MAGGLERGVQEQLAFLGLAEEDFARIRRHGPALLPHAEEIAEELYAHIETVPALSELLEGHLIQCKLKHTSYLAALLGAEVDETYALSRAWVGEIHRNVGVGPRDYVASYAYLLELLLDRLGAAPDLASDPQELLALARSLTKLVFFDISLALAGYERGQEEAWGAEQRALEESSAPIVLEVWPRVFVLVLRASAGSVADRYRGAVLQTLGVGGARRSFLLDLSRLTSCETETVSLVYELVALLEDFAASPRVVGCTEEFLRRSVALGHEPSRLVRVPDLARGVREIAQARGGRPRRPADRISP
ncbi:MAG TPA: hypothetical protein DEA08_09005 [Planctomycetes bacterium]|nr:hypothetical protein [Planctomycetota bacterium]